MTADAAIDAALRQLDARLHVLENVGHTAQLEVPGVTAEAVLSLVSESARDEASAA